MKSTQYLIFDENTFGYVLPNNRMGILHGSVLRGSPYGRLDGWDYQPMDKSRIRPATLNDFADYRIAIPPNLVLVEELQLINNSR